MIARICIALALMTLAGCQKREPLPILGRIPDFTLTDESGKPFSGATLRGHVWIADFIYTNCPGPCPLMSTRMSRLQKLTGDAVRLVSFSVDPARDTPAALMEYSHHFGALPRRWTFLTGDVKTLRMLDRDAFKLGDLDTSFNHSTRFVLVDGEGRIRAYYRMSDEDMVGHVAGDARRLATS